MPKLNSLKSDVDLEEAGIPVTMPDGWTATLRSTNCDTYRKIQQKQLIANRRFYARRGSPPAEVIEKQALELVVKGLLVDWSGLEDDDGNEIECTHENAYTILGDRKYRNLLDDISNAAMDSSIFRADEEAQDEEN